MGQPIWTESYYSLFFLDRKIVHIDMASQTIGEHFHLLFVMRFTMTFHTVRELAVRLMTNDTTNLPVLALRALPFAVNFIMTAATGLDIYITREINA